MAVQKELYVHIEGTFTVLMTNRGTYIAHVRLAGSDMLRVGEAEATPRAAITNALTTDNDSQGATS